MADPFPGVPAIRAEAEVRLWGRTVGAVVELESGRVVFEYDDDFRRGGLEISPVHLPLSLAGPQTFEELRRRESFQGLPGVLADSLPDAFGNRVIRVYYATRGQSERAMSPVQRLLYVGERALGALTYHPASEIPVRAAERESLEVAALVRDARRIVSGEPEVAVPEIYRIGSSAGGKRPKAVVLWDPVTREVRSGFAERGPDDIPCILKFDGVSDAGTEGGELDRPLPFNRIEAAYGAMGRAAGIEATEIEVLETGAGHAHLLVRRFDLEDGMRLHQHTLGGLVHVDYNEPGAASYEEYLRSILRLGMAQDAVERGYRRMVFNVLAVNQDDHVKNLSFQMDPAGTWNLTPAYDLTFARGTGWTATHQMRVADKVSGITEADLLSVAETFTIKKPERILGQVREAIAGWEVFSEQAGVPVDDIVRVRDELERREAQVGA